MPFKRPRDFVGRCVTSCIEARFAHFQEGSTCSKSNFISTPQKGRFSLQDNLAKKNWKKKEELTVMYKKYNTKWKEWIRED